MLDTDRSSARLSTTSHRSSGSIGPHDKVLNAKSQLRRFKSRSVPSVAENVKHEDPNVRQRFCGLMAHLRDNSVRQEEEHQVLSYGVGIVQEDAQILHDIFEYYCNIAERMNTELLSVTKFDRLLEDVLRAHHKPSKCRNERTVVFYRVLYTTCPPAKRLDFEGFCKSLGLLAMRMYPKMETQAALDHLVEMVVSAAYVLIPASSDNHNGDMSIIQVCGDEETYSQVLQIIKKFERILNDIFCRFSGINAVPGEGVDGNIGTTNTQKRQLNMYQRRRKEGGTRSARSRLEGCNRLSQHTTLPSSDGRLEYLGIDFGFENESSSPSRKEDTDGMLHGVPMVKGWQHKLNFQQWRCVWKDLGVYPYICTNRQLALVFKKSNDAHSAYGFLSYAGFLEAVIRLAVECYSESPWKDEFLTLSDRVNGFLHRVVGTTNAPTSKHVAKFPFALNPDRLVNLRDQ